MRIAFSSVAASCLLLVSTVGAQYVKSFNGLGKADTGEVARDPRPGGGFVVIPFSTYQVDFSPVGNFTGSMVAKYSQDGIPLWVNAQEEFEQATSVDAQAVTVDQQGNVWVAGTAGGGNGGTFGFGSKCRHTFLNDEIYTSWPFVAKLDSEGECQWLTMYPNTGLGGLSVTGVTVTKDGKKAAVVGYWERGGGAVTFPDGSNLTSRGYQDAYIFTLDDAGTFKVGGNMRVGNVYLLLTRGAHICPTKL